MASPRITTHGVLNKYIKNSRCVQLELFWDTYIHTTKPMQISKSQLIKIIVSQCTVQPELQHKK